MRSRPERVGVVFVHGIGSQTRSSTLRLFADPIVDWLTRWHDDHDRQAALAKQRPFIESHLSYGEQLPADVPPHVYVRLPRYADPELGTWSESEWYLAEGWWAARLEAPGLVRMIGWSGRAYLRTLARLITAIPPQIVSESVGDLISRVSKVRMPDPRTPEEERKREHDAAERREREGRRRQDETTGQRAWRTTTTLAGGGAALFGWSYDRVALLGLLILYFVFGLLGFFLVVIPLAIVAQIPVLPERIGVLNALRLFLTENIGDFYTYLFDEIQALHIRDGVLEAVAWLKKKECDRICVVGHSQGAVVAFDVVTQTDRPHPIGVGAVTKLITVGEALNNAWKERPHELRRVTKLMPRTRLPGIRWVDFWSAYDPVPGARPDIGVVPRPPESEFEPIEVSNFMDVVVEHGGYFVNTEEFVSRLAQEIDTPGADRQESRFWVRGRSAWDERVVRRRRRVRILLFWRGLGMVAFVSAVAARRDGWDRDGKAIADVLPKIPGLKDLGDFAVQAVSTIAPAHELIALLAFAAVFEVAYLVLVRPLWGFWDHEVRNTAALRKLPRGLRWIPFAGAVTLWAILVYVEAASIVLRQQLLPLL